MKTNKDFRKSRDDSHGSEYVKGKLPLKEKKSKRSIYNEIEEDEDFGYSKRSKKESVEDYFDDYDDSEAYSGEFVEDFNFIDDDFDDFDDDEY
ncbi:MAG: hypothetical protein LBB53_00555 [Prevotellaceae bacterium]|jgi:hypothetical protein|nr:hypothetical protein [Prevotellaceae bacterium]